jgi:hypothetical protein
MTDTIDTKLITFHNGLVAVKLDTPNLLVKAFERVLHGDWKTQLVREEFMGMQKGETGILLRIFNNFEGQWCTVKLSGGRTCDVAPGSLDAFSLDEDGVALVRSSQDELATENPLHDKWFTKFYTEGSKLRDHPAYLYSLWAWQARSCLPKPFIIGVNIMNEVELSEESGEVKYKGKKFQVWRGGQEGDWEELSFQQLSTNEKLNPERYLMDRK